MRVILSKSTGYCLGVKKTIEKAIDVLNRSKSLGLPAYSIGALIHNTNVVEGFKKQGLQVLKDSNAPAGVALVRAHGISESIEADFKSKGFILEDSTCSVIVKNRKAVARAIAAGKTVVVVGNENHAEARTLLGTGKGEKIFISSALQVGDLKISKDTRLAVVVQTTFSEVEFENIKKELKSRFNNVEFLNQLCPVCLERKRNALELCSICDAIVVVGGKNSANNSELAHYIEKEGKPVFCVENVGGFDNELCEKLRQFKTVGLCSGTSTPSSILEETQRYLEKL